MAETKQGSERHPIAKWLDNMGEKAKIQALEQLGLESEAYNALENKEYDIHLATVLYELFLSEEPMDPLKFALNYNVAPKAEKPEHRIGRVEKLVNLALCRLGCEPEKFNAEYGTEEFKLEEFSEPVKKMAEQIDQAVQDFNKQEQEPAIEPEQAEQMPEQSTITPEQIGEIVISEPAKLGIEYLWSLTGENQDSNLQQASFNGSYGQHLLNFLKEQYPGADISLSRAHDLIHNTSFAQLKQKHGLCMIMYDQNSRKTILQNPFLYKFRTAPFRARWYIDWQKAQKQEAPEQKQVPIPIVENSALSKEIAAWCVQLEQAINNLQNEIAQRQMRIEKLQSALEAIEALKQDL